MANYGGGVSRTLQVVIGTLALLFSVPLLALVIWAIWRLPGASGDERTSSLVVAVVFGLFAGPAALWGTRLLLGRRRTNGELLSPLALRVTGVVILLLPILFLATNKTGDAAFSLLHLGAAAACFATARQRSRRRCDPAEPPGE